MVLVAHLKMYFSIYYYCLMTMGESVPVWSNQKKRDEARTRQKDQQKQKKSWKDFMVDKILSSYAQVASFFVG